MRTLPRLAATLATAFAASTPALSSPLVVGESYRVQDRAGTAFTPSPSAGAPNGWYTDLTIQVNGASTAVRAGLFVLDHALAGASSASWTAFESFCLQPEVLLAPFSSSYVATSLGDSRYPQPAIAELWGRFRHEVRDGTTAAAFQVALWELAFGTTDHDLATGAFRLVNQGGNTVYETAQSWLTAVGTGDGPVARNLVVLVSQGSPDRQDLITTVPVPASMALVGLGLLGLAAPRRRRPV